MSTNYQRKILQDDNEFGEFIALARSENVSSYLEIGSKHGGSFWRMSLALPPGARMVSVDLPHGDQSFKDSLPNLRECVEALRCRGFEARLFVGDSTAPDIVGRVRELAPFDLVFIDANHTEPFVRADWKNYGPLARIVAFHDIAHVARMDDSKKLPIDVPKVWRELKQDYRHREIRHCPRDNGIGIIWRT